MALCGMDCSKSAPPVIATDTETVHAPIIQNAKNLDRMIKSKKYPVNTLDHFGNSPLHIAALRGNVRHVQVLIANYVNRTYKNLAGKTALHVAIENLSDKDALPIVELLIFRIHSPFKQQLCTPMYNDIKQGFKTNQEADAFCLVNMTDKDELSPLYIATMTQKPRVVIALLQFNAMILNADQFGNTALHIAIMSGNLPLADILLKEHLARFKVYMAQTPNALFHEAYKKYFVMETNQGKSPIDCARNKDMIALVNQYAELASEWGKNLQKTRFTPDRIEEGDEEEKVEDHEMDLGKRVAWRI